MFPVSLRWYARQTATLFIYYIGVYCTVLYCLVQPVRVFLVMLVPSNVDVPVDDVILRKCVVYWCFVFGRLQHFANMAACPLHGACNFKTAKCYFCFSCSFREIYVFIVNMYMSQQINLFLYLLFSRKLGHDHVITLRQQSSQVKLCYSRDHLISLKNCISPISYSLCATICSLGIHAPNHLCILWKCRKRHRRRR